MASAEPARGIDIATKRIAQRTKPELRRRMSGTAMRTYFKIAEKWTLSAKEQMAILGSPASSTFYKYKAGDVGTLSH